MILSFSSINQLIMREMDQIEVFISIADEICGSLGLLEGPGNIKAQQI